MEEIKKYFEEKQIPFNDDKLNKYERYMDEILEMNKNINLTAITDRDEFVVKHYIDSLAVYNIPEYREGRTIIDIGTGGGFPGIPLAIADEKKEFTLTDSLRKRLRVIEEIAGELGIENIDTVHGRAELTSRGNLREKFDISISRAVANLSTLSEYCLPHTRVGGYMLAYKGPNPEEEIKSAKRAIEILGGKIIRVENVEYDEFNHSIIVIKKIKKTPKNFPRKPGTPGKQPL